MPAGMFYYKFDTPIVKYEKEMDISQLNKMISKNMRYYGISVDDRDIILALDNNAKDEEKKSCETIKFKSDDLISKSSHVFTYEEIGIILDHSMRLAEKFAKEILSGITEARPYKSSCEYCDYKNICNFDVCFEKNNYKKMENVNKNSIIEKIKGQSDE
jgi:ATP-dependent helicase/nuclease subunit B